MAEKEEVKMEEQVIEQTAPVQSEEPKENGLSAYYREKYPDMTFEAEGDLFEDAAVRLRDAEERNAKYDEANAALAEVMEDYPEFAEIISDLQNGVELRVALARQFDPEDLVVEPGEYVETDWAKAKEERAQRRKEAKERSAAIDANWKESLATLDSMKEWDEEKEDEFGQWLGSSLTDIAQGKITPELLKKLRHGFIFEEAVDEARKEGEIEARNSEIEAKRIKKAAAGDGMPQPGASSGPRVEEEAPEEYDPFGDVDRHITDRAKRLGRK